MFLLLCPLSTAVVSWNAPVNVGLLCDIVAVPGEAIKETLRSFIKHGAST